MKLRWLLLLPLAGLSTQIMSFSTSEYGISRNLLPRDLGLFDNRPDGCPPCPSCFNCNLEDSPCMQFGNCTASSGLCKCPAGFGDQNCSKPLCGSLADGDDRPQNNKQRAPFDNTESLACDCPDGWEGINCNVCTSNKACGPLKPEGVDEEDMMCYKQGLVQKENHQMCDVTNAKIRDQLKERKPQVTFSCNADTKSCNFQCKSFYIDTNADG